MCACSRAASCCSYAVANKMANLNVNNGRSWLRQTTDDLVVVSLGLSTQHTGETVVLHLHIVRMILMQFAVNVLFHFVHFTKPFCHSIYIRVCARWFVCLCILHHFTATAILAFCMNTDWAMWIFFAVSMLMHLRLCIWKIQRSVKIFTISAGAEAETVVRFGSPPSPVRPSQSVAFCVDHIWFHLFLRALVMWTDLLYTVALSPSLPLSISFSYYRDKFLFLLPFFLLSTSFRFNCLLFFILDFRSIVGCLTHPSIVSHFNVSISLALQTTPIFSDPKRNFVHEKKI